MGSVGRIGIWRLVVAPLVALALLAGYIAYVHSDSAPGRPAGAGAPATKKLTLDDMLLAAASAKGIHLFVDGITGAPSTTHTNHALIKSSSWGVTNEAPVGGGGSGTGKAVMTALTLTKALDKYSLPLLKNALKGTHLKRAILYFTNVNASDVAYDYLSLDLSDVLVTGVTQKSSGDIPAETISLTFSKVVFKTHLSGVPDQTLTFDVKANIVT